MSKKVIIFIVVAVVIAAAVWFGMFSSPAPTGGPMGGRPPTAVSVMELKLERILIQEILPGRVTALRQAEIRPQVNGIITQRLYEEGAEVSQGQALYQIDDTPYKATLNSRNADLQSAEADLKAKTARDLRYQELIKTNAVSGQAYDDVKAELDQARASVSIAKASVEVAQVDLDYTRVYAPIAGRIGKSSVTEGALVTTNQSDSLAVITQLDPVYIDINQPGVDAMRLRQEIVGKEIPVSVIINRDLNIRHLEKGVLSFSDVVVDETTGSVSLRAIVPNSNGVLLPGLFVHAVIERGERNVVLVPQRATSRQPDGSLTVWVIDQDNKVNPHKIIVSGDYKDHWIINEGVTENDTIVVEGYQKIAPGMTVSPSPWQAPN